MRLRRLVELIFVLLIASLCTFTFSAGRAMAEEAADEEEYTETVDLVQEGKFVTQQFGGRSDRKSTDTEDWRTELRRRLGAAMQNLETTVDISDLDLNRTECIDIIRQIYRESIKGNRFYISGTFSYYAANNIVTRIKIGYSSSFCKDDGSPDEEEISQALSLFDEAAAEAASYAQQGQTTLEQMLLAHDWVVRECEYDYESYLAGSVPFISYTAYGCLVDRCCVCNGYALAYSYILELLGYESYVVSSSEMNHAWNLIRPDSEWMHADITWDDPVFTKGLTAYGFYNDNYNDEGIVSHLYFLKSDSEIQELSHYKWSVLSGGDEIPAAVSDGLYDGALFCGDRYSSFYLNGDGWYFCKDGVLYKSKDLYGRGMEPIDLGGRSIYYLQCLEDVFYGTDFQNMIRYDPSQQTYGECINAENTMSEMAVRNRKLMYVVTDGESTKRIQYAPINVTEQPESVEALNGEQIQVHIAADGTELTYQWEYQGKYNNKWVKWAAGDQSTLLKTFSDKWDGWKTRCLVTDSYGNRIVSNTIGLSLAEDVPEIRIIRHPEDVSADDGEEIEFSVVAEGEGITYQWQFQGINSQKWIDWTNGKGSVLQKTFHSHWNGWKTRCVIKDMSGNTKISDTASITLRENPPSIEITSQPSSITSAAGESIVFSIVAEGEELTYQWQYQGVYNNKWTDFTEGNAAELVKTVRPSWNGWKVRCVVTDGSRSTVYSDVVTITIQ